MNPRTLTLLAVAVIAGMVWLNLQMFSVLDQQIDRMAQARTASAFTMSVGKLQYRCFIERRSK